MTLVEAPTDRLLLKALDRIDAEEVAVVDTPPGNERLLAKAIERADVVVVPTRIGGVETHACRSRRSTSCPASCPSASSSVRRVPTPATTRTSVAAWTEANVAVWGSVPERVSIATGPEDSLSLDGMDAYRAVWRRALRA